MVRTVKSALISSDISHIAYPYLIGSRGLEFSYLLTAYAKLLPDPPDAADACLDAISGKIALNLSGPQVHLVLLWAALISTSRRPSSWLRFEGFRFSQA